MLGNITWLFSRPVLFSMHTKDLETGGEPWSEFADNINKFILLEMKMNYAGSSRPSSYPVKV